MPHHNQIPKQIRTLVWNKYIGEDIVQANCFCCNVTSIRITHFVCGHIKSVASGGQNTVDNLRPICSGCNGSMGIKNMCEFMRDHGLNPESSLLTSDKMCPINTSTKDHHMLDESRKYQSATDKMFKCYLCHKSFGLKTDLARHANRKVSCISKRCPTCLHFFSTKYSLENHIARNTCKVTIFEDKIIVSHDQKNDLELKIELSKQETKRTENELKILELKVKLKETGNSPPESTPVISVQ